MKQKSEVGALIALTSDSPRVPRWRCSPPTAVPFSLTLT